MQPGNERSFPRRRRSDTTFADCTVKLGGNETRLLFHELRIVLPDLQEGLLVSPVEREDVHQYYGARVYAI